MTRKYKYPLKMTTIITTLLVIMIFAFQGDERSCGKCEQGYFECSHGSSSCYDEKERCNGRAHCANKADETFCSKDKCGPKNGTFLCQNLKCIKEAWTCDNTDDCGDSSDEKSCIVIASRKVIIAAVVGSLLCGLLLTVALGCTCRLYVMHSTQRGDNYISPVLEIEEEIWRRQSAPPNYEQAMLSSRPINDNSEEPLGDQNTHADIDVPLLDAHGSDINNSGCFNDDEMLDALGASRNCPFETNDTNTGNTESVGSSRVILMSGKVPGPVEAESFCDSCTCNVPVNEALSTTFTHSLNAHSYEFSVLEECNLVGLCMNCSSKE